jgi:hypothetical protein
VFLSIWRGQTLARRRDYIRKLIPTKPERHKARSAALRWLGGLSRYNLREGPDTRRILASVAIATQFALCFELVELLGLACL